MQQMPQYANENLDTDEARDAVQRILRRRNAIDQVIEITHQPKAAKKASAKKSTATKKKPAAKAKAKPAAKKKSASTAKAKSTRTAAKSEN